MDYTNTAGVALAVFSLICYIFTKKTEFIFSVVLSALGALITKGALAVILIGVSLAWDLCYIRLKLWNLSLFKRQKILAGVFVSVMIGLSYALSPYSKLLMSIESGVSHFGIIARSIAIIIFIFALSIVVTAVIIRFLDRLLAVKKEMVFLECAALRTGYPFEKYYMRGINNGHTYIFRTTKSMYKLLLRKRTIPLKVKHGIFGGLYVSSRPTTD